MVVLLGDGSGQELSKDNANTRMSSGEFFGGFVLEVYDDGSDNFTVEAQKNDGAAWRTYRRLNRLVLP